MRSHLASPLLVVALLASCGSEAPAHHTEPRSTTHARCTVALRFEDESPVEADDRPPSIVELPRTRVTLVRICEPGGTETRVVGSEPGVCQFVADEGSLLRARCWWAGQGSEIAVERVLRQLIARRAEWTEEGGAGPMSDVAELELPADAHVTVLGSETLPTR